MAADARIVAAVLLIYATQVFAQERCSYMTDIPRRPKPDDLPDIEWSGDWSQRPFIPAPERNDLCMDIYISNTQLILIDEEIIGDIAIAKLNYDGPEDPEVVLPMASGAYALLRPTIRNVDGEWLLIIQETQDYEMPGMQQYQFNVRINNTQLVPTVTLRIVNIDDNEPMIQALQPCPIPELGEPRLTECVYVVTDLDGEISTSQMSFEITSERGDADIFYMEGTANSSDWQRMTMTVGIHSSLNFEENPLHIFEVTALDSLPNTHTVTLMVEVQNVEHRPPRFIEIFAMQRFDEKTARNFSVRAIDGDTGIDKAIYYRLEMDEEDEELFETLFYIETIEGGHNGSTFYVNPIDRDELEREVYQLSIVAYKYDNESFATAANIVIIIDDVNDQRPEPFQKEYHITIDEETPMTLNFEDVEFGFHDRDLGPHAQYNVTLESVFPSGAEAGFYIAPLVGYQRQTFIMGTLDHTLLDYEVKDFQHITLTVTAMDLDNTDFIGVALMHIYLENWNDEEPIFEYSTQTVAFNETEGEGFFVARVRAHDLDIGDRVVHSLMGNAGDFLTIDPDTGDIHVLRNDSFDYHRQNTLFVQVRADDTFMAPFHTATSQLVIELYDVNNTPPTLRLPRGSPLVNENVPFNWTISDEITATDPDTTANLEFEIDWVSSYATKQGRETDASEYHGCAGIEKLTDADETGPATARLYVREVREGVTIDFEMFEVLYLTIRVRDTETVLGDEYDESTFTITIIDMNDNPPLWAVNSTSQEFRVREMAGSGTVIGSVLATDIDGPLYNQVRYRIYPQDGTPHDLVMIDSFTGQITVDEGGAIDADIPPRWHLYYTVVASDQCIVEDCPPDQHHFNTTGDIQIEIIDTNNKVPEADSTRFNATVYVYENAQQDDTVVQLYGTDLDRDDIYKTVSYQIDYGQNERLRAFFEVERETGRVFVNYLQGEVLDRDGNEPNHTIRFQLFDNFLSEGDGFRNQNTTEVVVILLDINDNKPELPPPESLSWSISEGLTAGTRIQPDIYAPDIDEPDTDNSRVGYRIIELNHINPDIDVPDLFTMIQIENVTGELETIRDLRGFWGTYSIFIEAYDHGDPQLKSNETYQMVINPYNFHEPVFVFPLEGTTIRLAREWAIPGLILRTVDNENMENIFATDEDGLEAGVVTFAVTGDDEAEEYFEVNNHGSNFGNLQLTQDIVDETREFQVTITATDSGTTPGALHSETTFRVVFVPTTGTPFFEPDSYTVAFVERDVGMTERFELPHATDLKNYLCTDNCHSIYYNIALGNDAGHFAVDAATHEIYLLRPLIRDESAAHTLTVVASNTPTSGAILPGLALTLHVVVREAEPRPIFESKEYTAGITTTDIVGRQLLTFHATHTEGVTLTYTIDRESMTVHPSLENVRDTAFVLDGQSGVLTLNMQPTAAMQGMFEFNVIATDPASGYDTAEAKVFLVSTQNRVFFLFLNTVEQVVEHSNFIAQTFSEEFGMTCNVDNIIQARDENGVALETMTEMRAHFIDNDIPVDAEVIEDLRSDLDILMRIRGVLLEVQILFQDFLTESSPELGTNVTQITIYVLAALCAILGFMVVVLLLTFIFRTRSLNRRMAGLVEKRFGSMDSGLNRVAHAPAPGTNQHTVEGSNPIYSETLRAPDFDALSDTSDDSDLVGIEDMPQFRADYFPPEDVNSLNDIVRDTLPSNNSVPISNHANDFGFNTSPFSPEFTNNANSQFRRL